MTNGVVIRLVVGLGNPEKSHENDRHNVGFWLLDEWVLKRNVGLKPSQRYLGVAGKTTDGLNFLKPTTYMNLSGQSVAAYAKYFSIKPTEILVAHDDLDLDVGSVRLKYGGGHAGHNGLKSITQSLGSDSYCRIRIGIGRPERGHNVSSFVLGKPKPAERSKIVSRIDDILAISDDIVSGSFEDAMNTLNRRTKNQDE
jgi:PTH1 family peptidyl-tRNA hydrolase